jgi:hypothetical protein
VVQVTRQLGKLSTRCLLLPLLFFQLHMSLVVFQTFTNLLVLKKAVKFICLTLC